MAVKTNHTGTLASTFVIGPNGSGTLSHGGLTPTSGTSIDQIFEEEIELTLSTSWQDTTITSTDLATGTYAVQVHIDNISVGGGQEDVYYSGIMSWYSSDTDETSAEELALHQAGHSNSGNAIFLRVQRTDTGDSDDLKLQIASTNNDSGVSAVTFKFRRLI